MSNQHTLIMLYAGPLDGLTIETADPTATSFVLPVKDQPNAVYVASPAWSAHFNRRVATHTAFPGKPPAREHQPS